MDSGNAHLNLAIRNHTVDENAQSTTYRLVVIFVVLLPGIFGNILVLVIFRKGHIPLDKPVNILIRSLAVCDLLVLTNILTFTGLKFIYPGIIKQHGYLTCTLNDVSITLPTLYSSFIAACMAIDRFLGICAPFFYEAHITIKKVILALIFGAVIVMGIVAIKFTPLSCQARVDMVTGSCITFWRTTNALEDVYGSVFASFGLLCTSIIVITNTGVLMEVTRMSRRISPQTTTGRRTAKVHIQRNNEYFEIIKPEVQFAKTLLGVLCITVICWIPMVARIIGVQTGLWRDDRATNGVIFFCFGLPIVLDPYSYVILRRQYRKASKKLILKLFRKCCCHRHHVSTTDHPEEETTAEGAGSTQ